MFISVVLPAMFLKDRRPVIRREEGPRVESAPPPVTSLYVVIGLVEEGGTFRAHIEDRRTGQLLMLQPGDALAEGVIRSVDLDGVVYAADGGETRVAIGEDLRGEIAARATPPTEAPEPGEPPAAGDAPTVSNDTSTMSIEERMRQRRLQGGR